MEKIIKLESKPGYENSLKKMQSSINPDALIYKLVTSHFTVQVITDELNNILGIKPQGTHSIRVGYKCPNTKSKVIRIDSSVGSGFFVTLEG